ncbi:EF-hand domain-containing protein D2 [Salpingoeca rosetta]|uniref:EF-hand domain-containing protein D2 n=1 Tax=Salpingoeca rosetta (strain ATCC 50818 / BSB-021) TaxID=946362 RepID=F2U2A1_SALR5|nr:EF-hand domain-containing protein D2 [Salpingoeca rosetta]EGD81753.1 EF-hand domain-containing protein D2 [Salpingoeca rosetta]|eukprot:XP_004996957.1 EF-hand domain-containing protein D2 [Salpingoeca rosetta]
MSELADKLARRARINEGGEKPAMASSSRFNPYVEFPDMTRKEIKEYEKMFKKYDTSRDGFIDLMELKYMMEKLEHPQTHVALKAMISEVDEDNDGQISFREFLLIFHKAARGELQAEGLSQIADSVDVSEVGAKGAASFFESLAAKQAQANKFEEEIKAEQEEKKREAELARKRKEEFKKKFSNFQ